mmetsp:Transcript_32331/g.77556  ORF Transcript_32331/g.77556 Transcript_32331/m.77556 type:complete len:599 (-) Transcript_32331:148-1944(-)
MLVVLSFLVTAAQGLLLQKVHERSLVNDDNETAVMSGDLTHQADKPFFTSETMPNLGAAERCILCLAMGYFLYVAGANVLRHANEMRGNIFRKMELVLFSRQLMKIPALCVLFLACHLRAVQLSKGQIEEHHLPPQWVQSCTFVATWGILLQLLSIFALGRLQSYYDTTDRGDPEEGWFAMDTQGTVGAFFVALRCSSEFAMHVGAFAVMVAIFTMQPADKALKEMWEGDVPSISESIRCACSLVFLFLFVNAFASVAVETRRFLGSTERRTKLVTASGMAKSAVQPAPVLALLIVAERLRALQDDLRIGNPQPWATASFYTATFCLAAHVLVVLVVPFFWSQLRLVPGAIEGDCDWLMANGRHYLAPALVTALFRYIFLFGVIGGYVGIAVSLLNADSKNVTLQTPPAFMCSVLLGGVYLAVHFGTFVASTARQCLGPAGSSSIGDLVASAETCSKVAQLAPVLMMVFLIVRLRALGLAFNQLGKIPAFAGPECWAQEAMPIATMCVLLRISVDVVAGVLFPVSAEEEKLTAPKIQKQSQLQAVNTVRGVSLFLTVCATAVVGAAAFIMTPENLPPFGPDFCPLPWVYRADRLLGVH